MSSTDTPDVVAVVVVVTSCVAVSPGPEEEIAPQGGPEEVPDNPGPRKGRYFRVPRRVRHSGARGRTG